MKKDKKKSTTAAAIAQYPDRVGQIIRRPVPKVDKDYEEWLTRREKILRRKRRR